MIDNNQNQNSNLTSETQNILQTHPQLIQHSNKRKKVVLFLITFVLVIIFVCSVIFYQKIRTITNIPVVFKNYSTLSNQADQNKMSQYSNKVISKNIPVDNQEAPREFYGIFSGFDENNIQAVTNNGVKNIPLAKNLNTLSVSLLTEQATSSANIQGETLSMQEIDKNKLFNTNNFGKLIQIILTSDSKTVQSIFLND